MVLDEQEWLEETFEDHRIVANDMRSLARKLRALGLDAHEATGTMDVSSYMTWAKALEDAADEMNPPTPQYADNVVMFPGR
jgi:hypothetical protein